MRGWSLAARQHGPATNIMALRRKDTEITTFTFSDALYSATYYNKGRLHGGEYVVFSAHLKTAVSCEHPRYGTVTDCRRYDVKRLRLCQVKAGARTPHWGLSPRKTIDVQTIRTALHTGHIYLVSSAPVTLTASCSYGLTCPRSRAVERHAVTPRCRAKSQAD